MIVSSQQFVVVFFPPSVTAGFSLTIIVARKILAVLTLKPAFQW